MSSLYQKLPSAKSTRLLRLHPGSGDELISCSLEVINDYSSPPPYLALSYYWGNAKDLIELVNSGQPFSVTKNLYAALHRLRHNEQSSLVWADAICVNQNNVAERNQQVSIMKMIYQHAAQVVIWIGPAKDDTAGVMAMIRKLLPHYDRTSDDPSVWFNLCVAEVKVTDFSRAEWKSFWHFYRADWFFRVWVIQEVRQHQKIKLLCGTYEIDWTMVALAAGLFLDAQPTLPMTYSRDLSFIPDPGYENASFMWDQNFSTPQEAPFLALLDRVRDFRASDSRDKVFAMLNHRVCQLFVGEHGKKTYHPTLSGEMIQTHLNFRADYNMSTYEVYREVALRSLKQYQNLEVLCYAWQTAHHSDLWPSWIPRWDIRTYRMTREVQPFLFNAARGSTFGYDLSPSMISLILKGLSLGSILKKTFSLDYQEISGKDTGVDPSRLKTHLMSIFKLITQGRYEPTEYDISATRIDGNSQRRFLEFLSLVLSGVQSRKKNILSILQGRQKYIFVPICQTWCNICERSISKAICRASFMAPSFYHCNLCNDNNFDMCNACYERGERCLEKSHSLTKWEAAGIMIPYTAALVEFLEAHAVVENSELFPQILSESLGRGAFLKTSRGAYGTAHIAMQPGDTIAVLFGSRVPLILRKHGSAYRLVSDCYLEGVMDGEAMDLWEKGELKEEEFELR